MTTEEDFHNHLDQHPDDHHARMVFADWLDEQGDLRGPGYRALGKLRRQPHGKDSFRDWTYHSGQGREDNIPIGPEYSLPFDWMQVMTNSPRPNWGNFKNRRRDAEDLAALAFSRLPPERQQELLADPVQMKRRVKNTRMRRLSRS